MVENQEKYPEERSAGLTSCATRGAGTRKQRVARKNPACKVKKKEFPPRPPRPAQQPPCPEPSTCSARDARWRGAWAAVVGWAPMEFFRPASAPAAVALPVVG